MEDDEECKNVVEPQFPEQATGLTLEEKSVEVTVDDVVTNTEEEQCEFFPESVPELADSPLLVAESSIEEAAAAEGTSTVPELEGSPVVVDQSPIKAEDVEDGGEMKAEVDSVERGVEKSVSSLDDSEPLTDKALDVAKDIEVVAEVAEEELPNESDETEMRAETEQVESGLGFDGSQVVTENAAKDVEVADEMEVFGFDGSQIVGANSPVAAGEGVAVAEGEVSMVSSEMEMKCEEGVEGGVSKVLLGSNELELVGDKSLMVDEVAAVEEVPHGGNEMELENEVETEFVPELESREGEYVPELDDSQLLGVEESIPPKEDEDEEATEMEMEREVANEVETTSLPQMENLHNVDAESLIVTRDDEDEEDDEEGAAAEVAADDETPMGDTEMETETEVAETTEADKRVGSGGKRKRGRVSKVPGRAPPRKLIGEDVCFICFDGGDLVLCDRRNCPKAYHPSCVNRDEAFFQARGRWNCGWHLCSICEKNAHYMCYTCTFSLCKACIKDAVIFCVRGNKGFCETCMKTVTLLENRARTAKEDRVDFDDKSSWEYLFNDYWVDLKAQLSISSDELARAKNPWKGSYVSAGKQESPDEVFEANNDQGSGSESSEKVEASKQKRRKAKKRSKSLTKEEDLPSSRAASGAEGTSIGTPIPRDSEWASKDLLEFVMHMKNGEKSVLSQFDVQALLLEYIKRNKLRDPRRKSQIICDARLESLFGKARVGHFEMLKLLESHFLVKEDSQTDDAQGTVVDTEANQLEADGTLDVPTKGSKDRRRKMRKRGDDRRPQSNLHDYAAIDMHNISLIYLRRKLVEDLLEDIEKFHDKVVGTFVRIRISGSNQKQDMYRLVQVVGTRTAEPYKVGKKTADLVLEILNLNKTEVVSIDTISNQEFTEDECKRLRQSIKCGLITRLTVGDILDKAMEVQEARVNDWMETETVRLSHLRDRASEKGRRKELRECVEKLQLLKTPEERLRRLEEVPKIHADPNMDPSFESEEDDTEMEDNKQELYTRPRGSGFSRKEREPISPRGGNFSPTDSGSGSRKRSGNNWEINKNLSSKDFPSRSEGTTYVGEIPNDNVWNEGRDKEANNMEKVNLATDSGTVGRNSHSFVRSESFSGAVLETSQASLAAGVAEEPATKINETEKMWHYKDPAGKVQGPFSLVQLRKWNNNKYFPADLRIWRTTENQDDSILLADALAGKFQKELPPMANNFTKPQTVQSPHLSSTHTGKLYGASLPQGKEGEGGERLSFVQSPVIRSQELSSSSGRGTPSVEVPKVSAERLGSDYGRNDSFNLPSPTPMSSTPGWVGGQASIPVQQAVSVLGPTHSPAVATSDDIGQLARSSSSINQSGIKEHIAIESSVLNSVMELMRGPENDSSSSLRAPNSEQGIFVGSTTALPTPQMTSQSQVIHPSVETQQWGSGSVQMQEMAAPHQTAGSDTSQVWGGASSQNPEPNPPLPVPVQPAAYGHWSGVPSTVQNPTGNFPAPAFSAFPQPEPWRPPVVAGNQPNMQPAAPPNVPWGMGVAQNNTFAPGPRPDNVNTIWVPMQGNPNMGWVGPAPGSTNMNWGAAVQGPVPVSVNQGWVAPTGNPGAMVQGIPPGNANPVWPAQTGNPGSAIQGPLPGNGNPGWVAPTGNPGFNMQGQAQGNVNPGWVPSPGNPGTPTGQGLSPGNANPGWSSAPAGNSGRRGNDQQRHNDQRHNGNRFSGQRDRGFQGRDSGGFGGARRWNNNQQKAPNTVCPFHQNGHCKKGAACDMLHT